MTARCPYCQAPIAAGDAALMCPICNAVHHADCYTENGGCAVYGCTARPTDIPSAPQMQAPVSTSTRIDLTDLEPTNLPRVTYPQGITPPRAGRGLTETEKALIIAAAIIGVVIIVILVMVLG